MGRNLHAAFARRHWFNAHYVHDRARVLRRFGARRRGRLAEASPPLRKRLGKAALFIRPGVRRMRHTSQQAVIRADNTGSQQYRQFTTVHAVF